MKFKIDENLPIDAAELLREVGCDTVTVIEQRMSGRLRSQDKRFVLQVFERSIALLPHEPLAGYLWIVEEEQVRIRG